MREWIAVHGTPEQRERLAAGVLPFQEFLDALGDLTFRPLSHLTPYELDGAARMQEQLRQLPGHADVVVTPHELSVVTRLLPTATATQWSLATEIRKAIPGAQVQLREGEPVTLSVRSSTTFYGRVPGGSYQIRARDLRSVDFAP